MIRQKMLHDEKKKNPPYERSGRDENAQDLVSDPCLYFAKDKPVSFNSWHYRKPFRSPEHQGGSKMTEFMQKGAEKIENGPAEKFYFHHCVL